MDKPRSFAPIIAAVLLLLPMLYVGSYLALVTPGGTPFVIAPKGQPVTAWANYRAYPDVSAVVFWPLEQIDRRVRPDAW